MTQKKIGNSTEQKICNKLQSWGYWVHRFGYTQTGQPCDIVCLSDDKQGLIDAKHCDSHLFELSRCEQNQLNCFKYATECGVMYCGFAIEYWGIIYWLPFYTAYSLIAEGKKSIDVRTLKTLSVAFEDRLERGGSNEFLKLKREVKEQW